MNGQVMKRFEVKVYDREKDGDSVVKINANNLLLVKLINLVIQRVLRFPRFTTVVYESKTNSVWHFKSDPQLDAPLARSETTRRRIALYLALYNHYHS